MSDLEKREEMRDERNVDRDSNCIKRSLSQKCNERDSISIERYIS